MKRTLPVILAGFAAIAVFAALVYAVLVVARVSEPGAVTVHGLTTRRLWATAAVLLAAVGVTIGVMALIRPVARDVGFRRFRAAVALAAGLIAALNGGVNLAVASGGPGTGNGVVGGAVALVLGLIALTLGGIGLTRSRRIALESRHAA